MTATFRTRFAPSPTGDLHAGNARTAIFCFLAARAAGGEMLLRIEDSDRARNVKGGAAAIVDDLSALGLEWREVAPQSSRARSYEDAMRVLQDVGAVYPCFCTPDELAAHRKQCIARGIAPRYSGKCANLTVSEALAKVKDGAAATMRFRMPKGRVEVQDKVRGAVWFDGGDIGDFIVRRANGDFSFIFVNALDDAADGISCVLRGEDHLPNVPRQMAILSALKLPAPDYGHLPLMTDAGGKPLSKRGGAPSMRQLREEGYLPTALINYLSRIGHKFDSDGLMTAEELATGFSLDRLSKAAAKFDMQQLQSRQRETLRSLTPADKLKWMASLLPLTIDGEQFATAICDNVMVYSEVSEWVRVITDDEIPYDNDATKIIEAAGKDFFRAALEVLTTSENNASPEDTSWQTFCTAIAKKTNTKGKTLYMPLRAALTGKTKGPQMQTFYPLIPQEKKHHRLTQHSQ